MAPWYFCSLCFVRFFFLSPSADSAGNVLPSSEKFYDYARTHTHTQRHITYIASCTACSEDHRKHFHKVNMKYCDVACDSNVATAHHHLQQQRISHSGLVPSFAVVGLSIFSLVNLRFFFRYESIRALSWKCVYCALLKK